MPESPYARDARAREGIGHQALEPGLLAGLSSASPLELRQYGRACMKAFNRERWRRLNQTRCSILASALHAIEIAMGQRYAGRERTADKRWVAFGSDDDGVRVPVVEIALRPMHKFEDYSEPVLLRIKETALIDVDRLRAWRRWTRDTWGQSVAGKQRPGWR
jgi:hypothetical protein